MSEMTYAQTMDKIDQEITLSQNALATSLSNHARLLHKRFSQRGTLADLEEAIRLARSSLELRPRGNPNRDTALNTLAAYLSSRFKQFGTFSDLEEALGYGRNALELREHGHPLEAVSLGRVASDLSVRFKHLGVLSDLEEALILGRRACELRPPGHNLRVFSLSDVARDLSTRFKQFGELPDLEEALSLQHAALELRSPRHPYQAISLCRIAENLYLRFKSLGTQPDLEKAISFERSALVLRQNHPRKANSLRNLATYLLSRFDQLREPSNLEEALSLGLNALELIPKGHPDRASSLGVLACCFHARSKHVTGNVTDLEEMFSLYSQLSDISHTAFLNDVHYAKQWIDATEEYRHGSTLLAYETFIRLSGRYLATLPTLPQHLALLRQLTKSIAANAFSAGLRYRNATTAVDLLEQGRGIFWKQLIRLRTPLDDVMASGDVGRELADNYTKVTMLLRDLIDDSVDTQSQYHRALQLNMQLQDIFAEIRKLPGLSHFLQPLRFSDLRIAAAGGPVIIVNASQYSCDAVVLLSDKNPIHIPLRITRTQVIKLSSDVRSFTLLAKYMDVTNSFVPLLRELWNLVVFPVVQILEEFCPRGSRIWWCPTVEFSLLPLHAAGLYRNGQLNFSDHYISSYTPTLSALIRARQRMAINPSTEQCRLLVVGQAQTLGQKKLISVNKELINIAKQMEPIATVTCIQDDDAKIATVGDELRKTHFVHFACHGIPDRQQPFQSGFGLDDGRLKIEGIMQYDLPNAQFAYLSACHTTVGDRDSPDEAIHLAAAMQFAGFNSVIGTTWAVDDAHTDQITSTFYGHMLNESGRLDPGRAALALHKTTRSLFSTSCTVPFDQRIVYVHIGP